MKTWKIAAVAAAVLLCAVHPMHADNIRGPLKKTVELSTDNADSAPVPLVMEEMVRISTGKDLRFFQAVELSVELPKIFLEYGDSFAVFVYGRITQQAGSEGISSFKGTKLLSVPFHFRQKLYIRIPFVRHQTRDLSPDTVVYAGTPDPGDFPILVTILPIMKGVPETLYETSFPVSARLVPSGDSSLLVRVGDGQGNRIAGAAVKIAGKAVTDPGKEQILKPGIYSVEASAPGYKSEQRSVTVEEARPLVLEIELVPSVTAVRFEAPKDAVIYLDGERIEHAAGVPVRVTEGRHSVILKVGDYQVTKNFTAVPGKTYRISVFLDISIEEN